MRTEVVLLVMVVAGCAGRGNPDTPSEGPDSIQGEMAEDAEDSRRTNAAMADTFAHSDARFPDDAGRAVLLYIPNRLVDLLDIVHVGVGLGFGLGIELHPTRHARVGAVLSEDAGVAWLGRFTSPWQAASSARVTVGEFEAGVPFPLFRPRYAGVLWRPPVWDVGAHAYCGLVNAYAAIAPDEIVDFFAGLTTFDPKKDDW
jgi:hypothetical protein